MKQFVKCSAPVTCNSSSILIHVFASFSDRVSPNGEIDVSISDHQLIYCTRKTERIKIYRNKQITFRFLKHYLPEIFEEALMRLNFLNHELFDDIDKACENLIQKVMAVVDDLA